VCEKQPDGRLGALLFYVLSLLSDLQVEEVFPLSGITLSTFNRATQYSSGLANDANDDGDQDRAGVLRGRGVAVDHPRRFF
jgi:hypothetical protein